MRFLREFCYFLLLRKNRVKIAKNRNFCKNRVEIAIFTPLKFTHLNLYKVHWDRMQTFKLRVGTDRPLFGAVDVGQGTTPIQSRLQCGNLSASKNCDFYANFCKICDFYAIFYAIFAKIAKKSRKNRVKM